MYSGLSTEKYNLMKPSKKEKSASTIKRLRDYIGEKGNMCITITCFIFMLCLCP